MFLIVAFLLYTRQMEYDKLLDNFVPVTVLLLPLHPPRSGFDSLL